MKKTILEIIAKINKQKNDANLHPDYVTSAEIRTELYYMLDIELQLLVDDGILKQGDTINDIYLKVKE